MHLHAVVASLFADMSFYLRVLSPESYAQPIDILSNASIGQHTRHILEFYQCLVAQSPEGTIDYDARTRNASIEQDPQYTQAVMDILQEQIANTELTLALHLKADFTATPSEQAPPVQTTYGRELVYNIEHTIHHLAIIRIGLKFLRPDLVLPAEFGVAPSTLKYWEQQTKAAYSHA